jgi:hypothetical protein
MGYLIYHPRRQRSVFGQLVVYHDGVDHNQDPYVWNDQFLHSFCHMTQMRPMIGNINLWVYGNKWPEFDHLYCDLVFTVAEKKYWQECNHIAESDPIVDSALSYRDHYGWVSQQHKFRRLRRRFTLKADPDLSFQPQEKNGNLIDIVSWLDEEGLDLVSLRKGLRAGIASKPMEVADAILQRLWSKLAEDCYSQIYGNQLKTLREDDKTWQKQVSKR